MSTVSRISKRNAFFAMCTIFMLIAVVPSQAFLLSTQAKHYGFANELFPIQLTSEDSDFSPSDSVKLLLNGIEVCEFSLSANILNGCDDFIIDGDAINPGYGYGYGVGGSGNWSVLWNATPGMYNFSWKIGNVYESDSQKITIYADTSATLTIKEPYPKGNEFVFECNAQGYDAQTYDWNFGDGQKLLDISNQNVFHTYEEPGVYVVTCGATSANGIINEYGYKVVIVGEEETSISTELTIKKPYPILSQYVFECNSEGFNPDTYNWYFDDGESLTGVSEQNVFHQFTSAGTYNVSCLAYDDTQSSSAWLEVVVEKDDASCELPPGLAKKNKIPPGFFERCSVPEDVKFVPPGIAKKLN